MTSDCDITRKIVRQCHELGFALAGVSDARPTRRPEDLRRWLAEGRHGEMSYLERNAEVLLDPERLLPGARSIICVADRYADARPDHPPGPGDGRIARYARGPDYHKVIRKRLHQLCDELRAQHPDHEVRACVDTAPLLEREYAARAGLGAIGKHTLLIEQGVGSYLLLGEVVTTLALEPTTPSEDVDPCGTCTRCIDACPTDAISPWSVDATKCISYLTIEHRSEIDLEYHRAIDSWIFGCDICQEVCPHNQPTNRSDVAPIHDAYTPRHASLPLQEVLGWSEEDRRAAFAGSAMKRAKTGMMKRNALIAACNALQNDEAPNLRRAVQGILNDSGADASLRSIAKRVGHGTG